MIRKVYDIKIKDEKCGTLAGEKLLGFEIQILNFKFNESGEIPSDEEISNHYSACNLTSRFYSCSYFKYL